MSQSWSAASSLVSRPSAAGWPGLACSKALSKHCSDPVLRRPYAAVIAGSGADPLMEDFGRDQVSDRSDSPADDLEEDPLVRRRRVEAVLLLAKNPLSPRKLAQLAQVADATEVRTHVRDLGSVYQNLGRAMRIELVAGGYRMMTRSALSPWLSRLSHVPAPVRLSTPMMETLAIVAYRGPLARSSVEAIRGVACGELLRQLMERDLIRIAGRSEELGRPYLYGTTKRFLQLFGLANSEALPPIQWQTLQEDNPEESSQENPSVHSIPHDPSPDEASPNQPDEASPNQLDEASPDQGSTLEVSNSPVLQSPILHSPASNPSKEPVVSTLVASEPSSEVNPVIDPIIAASQAAASVQDWAAEEVTTDNPAAVIEDEEDDLYEGVNDDDDDDWDDEDDDWDDEEDDDDDVEDDDELDGDWEEVDDSEDEDDDEDDDEDLDDVDQADDDEDWSEDDDEDDDEEEDDEEWD